MDPIRVFVADDDREDYEMIQEALLSEGCAKEVHYFPRADLLLQKIEGLNPSEVPDLIVLDQHTPGTKSADALKEIRSQRKYDRITIAFYTSAIHPGTEQQLLVEGADFCLRKGSSFAELKTHAHYFCARTWQRKAHYPSK